jgi:transposase-like protein
MDKQISLVEFAAKFGTEEACIAHLQAARWPDGVRCVKCNGERISIYDTKGKTGKKRHLYECMDCHYQFSVTVGTIFHDSHIGLTKWFIAIRLMVSAKKGISAKQLQRELAVSYETAWYMAHRIRVAMKEGAMLLTGIVEVDETYIGGKAKNRHVSKRGTGKGQGKGGGGLGKIPVVGAVQRNGKVVARVIEKNDTATLDKFVRETVATSVSLLATDENSSYRFLKNAYPHGTVNHGKDEYVVGAVHTNTIEGFWSLFKRGIMGSFHKVSKKYLPLYIAEFEFRYNQRKEQAAMFDTVLGTCF